MEALLAGIDGWRYAAIEETQDDQASLALAAQRYRRLIEAPGTGTVAFTNAVAMLAPIFDGEDEIITRYNRWRPNQRCHTYRDNVGEYSAAAQDSSPMPVIPRSWFCPNRRGCCQSCSRFG